MLDLLLTDGQPILLVITFNISSPYFLGKLVPIRAEIIHHPLGTIQARRRFADEALKPPHSPHNIPWNTPGLHPRKKRIPEKVTPR